MEESLKILLVEDDPLDAVLLERELARAGLSFRTIRVEVEADFLREIALNPDVILCDFNLPQFDSLHALQLLQAHGGQIPFIVVSGSIGEERAVELLRRGANDFLLKDRLGRLGASVSQAVEQRRLQQAERASRQRLRDQEEQYRELADSMPQLVWMMNESGEFLYFNQQCVTYTGLEIAELTQGGWLAAILDSDQEGQGGNTPEAQLRIRNAAGSYRWHLQRRVAQSKGAGNIGWVGTCTDIHDQVLTEEALRSERDRFALIASVAPGVIHTYRLTADGAGAFTYLSPGASELFGVDRELFLSQQMDPNRLVHPDDLQDLLGAAADSAAHLTPWHSEYRILHPSKGERWLEARANPMREKDGSTLWHGFLIDITERKQAEADLRLRDRAIQAVSQGILISRPDQPDNPLIFVNPAVEAITGYPPSEMLGRNCRFLQGPDTDQEVLGHLRRSLPAGEPCSVEFLNYRKDGSTFWNALSIAHIRDHQKIRYSVAVMTDVTERKMLEARYQQAQKMEAFGQLAGGVAHDFNNLLTVINGYIQFMLEDLAVDDPIRENLEVVLEAGGRAEALTAQLLAFSRQTVIQPQVLSLNSVVEEVVKLLARVIGEDILIEVSLDPAPTQVKADPGQLHQVIMNLAVNARDAMPQGGRLHIVTRSEPDWIHLSVSDTGCGMGEAVLARIFEPFFTTKEVGKGTGLGLATVYGIAESCGGRVEVSSRIGKGSTFHFFLPPHRTETPSGLPQKSTEDITGKETVLVVEDEKGVRQLLRQGLEKHGYRPLVAESCGQALQIAREYAGVIDVLLTDIVMPGTDGRVLAEQILGLRPDILVLFISGHTDDALLRRGVMESTQNLLSKPFSILDVCQKLREIIDGQSS